jgi:hypothetical protein
VEATSSVAACAWKRSVSQVKHGHEYFGNSVMYDVVWTFHVEELLGIQADQASAVE